MPLYYCHDCAARRGLIRVPPQDLISTEYQLDKYIKHTVPDTAQGMASIFATTSTGDYRDLVASSLRAGAVEVDDQGRTNIVYRAGRPTGALRQMGRFVSVQAALRVVLSTSTGKIHAFPDDDARFANKQCADCGAFI